MLDLEPEPRVASVRGEAASHYINGVVMKDFTKKKNA